MVEQDKETFKPLFIFLFVLIVLVVFLRVLILIIVTIASVAVVYWALQALIEEEGELGKKFYVSWAACITLILLLEIFVSTISGLAFSVLFALATIAYRHLVAQRQNANKKAQG